MNKELFIRDLRRFLADLPEEERNAAIQYYEDYFNDAGPEREQQVIEELGSPVDIARQIKQTNQDSITYGEGSAPNRGAAYPEPANASGGSGQQHTGSASQGAPGSSAGNWGGTAAGTNGGQNHFTADADGSTANPNGNWNGSNAGANGSQNNSNSGASGNWNGFNAGANGGWNSSNAGANGSWGNAAGTAAADSSPWKTVLIVLICIFAIPVGIPLLCVVFAFLVTLLTLVATIIFTVVVTGIALLVSGIFTIILSFALFPISPANALLGLGAGLILTSLGGWILWGGILLCSKVFPAFFRGIWNGIKSIRRKGKE